MGKRGADRRAAKERASRQRRTANAKPSAALPTTEASVALAAALQAAGLSELAGRARRLEFDETYSRDPFPLRTLVAELGRAGRPALVDRVAAGEFDETRADVAAYQATPAGRAELAEYHELMSDPEVAAGAARFAESLRNADPKHLQQMGKQAAAEIVEQATGGPLVLPDDDRVVRPEELIVQLRGMLGEVGPDGQRLDTPEILAAAELVFRAGGREFEIGWVHDDVPPERRGWYAHVMYAGTRIQVQDRPGPSAAAAALVARILDGGQCQHCRRVSTTNPARAPGGDKTLLTGQKWSREEQLKAGLCVWRRDGVHWQAGCTR